MLPGLSVLPQNRPNRWLFKIHFPNILARRAKMYWKLVWRSPRFASQNVLKSDLKKSQIYPIWRHSDPLWSQIWHGSCPETCLRWDGWPFYLRPFYSRPMFFSQFVMKSYHIINTCLALDLTLLDKIFISTKYVLNYSGYILMLVTWSVRTLHSPFIVQFFFK